MTGFWTWAQTTLGATIVGGIIVVIVIGVGVRLRRPLLRLLVAAWRGVKRPWRSMRSLRVTTRERLEREREAGRQTLQAELDAQRAKPIAPVRWALAQSKDLKSATLYNSASGTATRVRVDPPHDGVVILGDGQWDIIPGVSQVQFACTVTDWQAVHYLGANFLVSWTDINGEQHQDSVRMKVWEPW